MRFDGGYLALRRTQNFQDGFNLFSDNQLNHFRAFGYEGPILRAHYFV